MAHIIILVIFLTLSIIGWRVFIKEFSQVLFWYWVPFVPTSDYKIEKLLENIELKKWQKFLDLWSWDGKVLEAIAKKFKWVDLYGIENSPFPYKESQERQSKNKLDYTVYKKDFFTEDFWKYDVIYSYTIPYLMKRIWKKIQRDCKPWTLFYSNSFEIKNQKAIKKVKTVKGRYIYIYKV